MRHASAKARAPGIALLLGLGVAILLAERGASEGLAGPEPGEAMAGGATSVARRPGRGSFAAPAAGLGPQARLDFETGRALFEKLWVTAPSSTKASDGLGPLYNARACIACHPGNDRGKPPGMDGGGGGASPALFLRVSVPDNASTLPAKVLRHLPNAPEPHYGLQIQGRSVAGVPAEGLVRRQMQALPVTLADGAIVELHAPTYELADPGYGPLHPEARLSPRLAPRLIGLGLLEAIPEADLLAHADPEDGDGDGISGRANIVWSEASGQWMTGRFGLKAGTASVRAQAMAAMNADIGLSNPLYPAATGDCTPAQSACLSAPDGNSAHHEGLEAPSQVMDLVTFYSRNIGVPMRPDAGKPAVLRGKALFHGAGCAACHVPSFETVGPADRPEQSGQTIWPYSDLLLHDMGEGLADHRREWRATGREWRTAPLWGIGLTGGGTGVTSFLHDGRAQSLLEAILWHGGEAEGAREAVRNMEETDRDDLVSFLQSL